MSQHATRSRRAIAFTGLVASGALVMAGCNANPKSDNTSQGGATGGGNVAASNATVTTPKKGGTLQVLSSSKELHWDPAKSQNLGTSAIHYMVRGLTAWGTSPTEDTKLVADMATDTGRTTDDGKTWTFELRDGLKYSDGTPITAADIKFGVERSFDQQLQGGLSYHKVLLEGATDYKGPANGAHLDSIVVEGDKKITFKLVRPFADWPWVTSMPAFAPIPADKGMGIPKYNHEPPSSGPYVVKTYQVGNRIELTRNPHWSTEVDKVRPAWPDTIVYQMGLNAETAAQRMVSDQGEDKNATGPSVRASLVSKVKADPKVRERVYISPSGALSNLILNMERPALKDQKVREAIQYAINKQSLQTIVGGPEFGGEIATTLLPPGVAGHKQFDLYPAGPTGNIDKAKQILGDTKVPELVMVTDASNDTQSKQAQSVVSDLSKLGISVKVQSMDTDAAAKLTSETGDFDLTFSGWQADYPSAYAALQPIIASSEIGKGNYNQAHIRSDEIDKAILTASAETDATKAAQQWSAIDEMAMKTAAIVPLYYYKNSYIYGSNVGGSYIPSFPSYTNALEQGLKQP